MNLFGDVPGAVFIVCLVITCRSVLFIGPYVVFPSEKGVEFGGLTSLNNFLHQKNKLYLFCFLCFFKCSLWSSAIILLVLVMIVVDLMVPIFIFYNYGISFICNTILVLYTYKMKLHRV